MDIRDHIRAVPDFPKPGIMFRDITPVMENPAAYQAALAGMTDLIADVDYTSFAAVESRGFIFGGPLGVALNKPMVLVRKAGKLPGETRAVTYKLEYGEATLEAHLTSFKAGDSVMIVDDLLATGGTAAATAKLVEAAGASVAGFLFLVELDFLNGRENLKSNAPVFSLIHY
ncbi:MAG: adenine phosphoribosyltransferase [Candidatus Krumholzibacteriia bacterium]|jgi:adenine phosphoribosyltransferase